MNTDYLDWQVALFFVALLIPLLVALLLAQPTMARRTRALDLAAWSALPACFIVMVIPDGYVDLHWLMLGSRFGLDLTGRVFLAFTAFLWLAGGVFARAYLREDPHAPRFFVFYLLSMAGNVGLVLAQDAVTFFVLSSFSSLFAGTRRPRSRLQ